MALQSYKEFWTKDLTGCINLALERDFAVLVGNDRIDEYAVRIFRDNNYKFMASKNGIEYEEGNFYEFYTFVHLMSVQSCDMSRKLKLEPVLWFRIPILVCQLCKLVNGLKGGKKHLGNGVNICRLLLKLC